MTTYGHEQMVRLCDEARQQGREEQDAELAGLRRDAAELARRGCCEELSEEGRPCCDPPCIVCRYSKTVEAKET